MSAVKKLNLIAVADYLAGELVSPIKHEYLGGAVYAMAGARNAHNLISSNILGTAYSRLRGRRPRAFNSDTKIRVRLPGHVRFYYPDTSIMDRALVEQETAAVVVFRRTENGFVREVYEGMDAVLPLPEIDIVLPLAEIYEAVDFQPEPEE